MKNSQPRHVLVYRLSALGDVAMTIPAVYSCAAAWPGVTFHVVTTAFCAQLFLNAPANVVLHPVEEPVATWPLLRSLRKIDIDAVADLHNVLRSWMADAMFLLEGKQVRMMAKNRDERRAILKEGKAAGQPFTMRYFDVFQRLGLSCAPCFSSLFKTLPPLPAAVAKMAGNASGRSKDDEPWIGIAPYARYENKTYPLPQMQQVAQQLAGHHYARVFLFGSRGSQADTLRQWEELSPRIHCIAGLLPLQQELALMAHLDVMLSMDSANQHLASLAGTRVVSVWGSTTPACGFMGWQQQMEDAVCLHLPCQPCTIGGSPRCRLNTLDCMRKLPPSAIIRQILVEK